MTCDIDLYNSHYGHLGADPQTEVRKETYGDDLGQSSWITLGELPGWAPLLQLDASQKALEVACRGQLVALEGEDRFEGLQRFLEAVHTLSIERRLSRFMYLAVKRGI